MRGLSELPSTLNTDLVATAHVRKWHKGDSLWRWSEYVRYVRSYCRAGNPARMPPRVIRMRRAASEDGGMSGPPSSRNRHPPWRASVRPHHLQHISTIPLELALPDAADLR
jgi:hypothetical protein